MFNLILRWTLFIATILWRMAKYILKTTQAFGSKIKRWCLMQWRTTVTGVKFWRNSSLDCLRMLVMKHFNTHNVRPRDILEPLTPKTKLSDNWFYMHCVKWYLLYKLMTEVIFWFLICHEWKHRKHSLWVCPFSGLEFRGAFTFKNKYCSSSSRFGTHIVSTVILTNYKRTHKATTRQSVWNRFYWQSEPPPNAHLLALSHI